MTIVARVSGSIGCQICLVELEFYTRTFGGQKKINPTYRYKSKGKSR